VASADAPARSAPDGFRSDINGLRAISITLVVAYHLAPSWVPGGFIGVDVFFVISGFLMTEIIVGRLRQGRFKLWEFYVARLRRIWPALVALCLTLWLVGCFALDPWTYERLAADIPATVLFGSNIVFAERQGYFAPDEGANWLLHTWSLAVEWQFYLLYPLLILAIFALPGLRRRLWVSLAALTAASFVLAVAVSTRGQGWPFYLLPTRAWELLAGALCAGAAGVRLAGGVRAGLHVGGLALIGIGAWVAVPGAGWPGVTTLLPVGGAALVIVSRLRRTFWAENPVVGRLGRASYSIYIWHWPVVVALRYGEVAITPMVALAAVAAMLALGFGSYFAIEQAGTRWLFAKQRRVWALAGGAGVLAVLALVAAQAQGFEAMRVAGASNAERLSLADDRAAAVDWAFPRVCSQQLRQGRLQFCRVGDPAARQVLVIGDSHAEQVAPRYAHAFDGRPGRGLTFLTAGGCPPIPGVGLRHKGPGCARWAAAAYRYAETAGFARVAIISTWQPYFDRAAAPTPSAACLAVGEACDGAAPPDTIINAAFLRLRDEVTTLRGRGIDVVLFDPTPRDPVADPQRLYREAFWNGDLQPAPLDRCAVEARIAPTRRELRAVSFATRAPLVDPLDSLCRGQVCPIQAGGRTLFKDAAHYRASAVTGPQFAYLDPWLAPAAAPIRLK
jgi:peptidoglycan/LPS O-acetylase OafA/YrhL